ncbi:MAG: ATP-binding protein [Anaerolineae bacterium]
MNEQVDHRPNAPARLADNPFTPHAPADISVFVGREREIDLIFGHVMAAQRGNVAICGPLGSGKSSLLQHVSHPEVAARFGAAAPTLTMLNVDVQSVTPFTFEGFWRRVARLIARYPGPAATALAPLAAAPIVDLIAVETALDDMDDRGGVLVLLLDEFEWAVHAASPEEAAECRHFLAQTATLARRTPRNLALVVATERPLHEVTREIESWRGSPFATLFTTVALKPLSDDHARVLLGRADHAAVRVDDADATLILEPSGGHPTVVHAGAFALVHGRRQGSKGRRCTTRSARPSPTCTSITWPGRSCGRPVTAIPSRRRSTIARSRRRRRPPSALGERGAAGAGRHRHPSGARPVDRRRERRRPRRRPADRSSDGAGVQPSPAALEPPEPAVQQGRHHPAALGRRSGPDDRRRARREARQPPAPQDRDGARPAAVRPHGARPGLSIVPAL